MILRAAALVAVALWAASAAEAACTWAVGTIGTKHYGSDTDFEEENWGVGVEQCVAPRWRLIAGAYRNSIRHDSVYAGASYELVRAGPVALQLAGGLVTGYNVEPAPMLLPILALEGQTFGANLILVPKTEWTTGAVGLQVKYRLK